jgi:dimethylargininase
VELAGLLQQLGIRSRIVNTPPDTLHLKSDCSLLAANALRLNETILIGDEFPETSGLLQRAGYSVRTLPIDGVGRLDAGLSCRSLRWTGTKGRPLSFPMPVLP